MSVQKFYFDSDFEVSAFSLDNSYEGAFGINSDDKGMFFVFSLTPANIVNMPHLQYFDVNILCNGVQAGSVSIYIDSDVFVTNDYAQGLPWVGNLRGMDLRCYSETKLLTLVGANFCQVVLEDESIKDVSISVQDNKLYGIVPTNIDGIRVKYVHYSLIFGNISRITCSTSFYIQPDAYNVINRGT